MEELYMAIVAQGIQDLFSRSYHKEDAYQWFMAEGESEEITDHITFIDACDLAGYNYEKWRKLATHIYEGNLTKAEYLEFISDSYKPKVVSKPPVLVEVDTMPVGLVYHSRRDTQDIVAQASLT